MSPIGRHISLLASTAEAKCTPPHCRAAPQSFAKSVNVFHLSSRFLAGVMPGSMRDDPFLTSTVKPKSSDPVKRRWACAYAAQKHAEADGYSGWSAWFRNGLQSVPGMSVTLPLPGPPQAVALRRSSRAADSASTSSACCWYSTTLVGSLFVGGGTRNTLGSSKVYAFVRAYCGVRNVCTVMGPLGWLSRSGCQRLGSIILVGGLTGSYPV